MTNTVGVPINLWIETTTSGYATGAAAGNYLRSEGGVNTFGEINLKGPGNEGQTSSVGLRFTFKRNDNGAEVTIPWMQFTLFDFDHNMKDGSRGQEVPRQAPTQPTTPPRTVWPHPATRAHGRRDPNRSA